MLIVDDANVADVARAWSDAVERDEIDHEGDVYEYGVFANAERSRSAMVYGHYRV